MTKPNDPTDIDRLLSQLSERVGVPPAQLRAIITRAAEENQNPRRADFESLRGQAITLTAAAAKYDVPRMNLVRWVRSRYVAVLDDGHPVQVDEADVAFCAAVRARRLALGITMGVPFFDKQGEPVYTLKLPEYAQYRARYRVRKKGNTNSTARRSAMAPLSAKSSARGGRR